MMVNANNGTSRTMLKPRGSRPDGWKDGDYKVCRATRKRNDIGRADLMIFRDRLDRWVSSRNMWNQHAYNIININDDGSLPRSASWLDQFLAKMLDKTITGSSAPRPKYNNYRLNSQGQFGAGTVPDITGKFIPGSICGKTEDNRYVISFRLCNRGTKHAASDLPATIYYYNENSDNHRGDYICDSRTTKVLEVGECDNIGCKVDEDTLKAIEGKKIYLVTNEGTHGESTTVECNYDNNADWTDVEKCESEIVIVN